MMEIFCASCVKQTEVEDVCPVISLESLFKEGMCIFPWLRGNLGCIKKNQIKEQKCTIQKGSK